MKLKFLLVFCLVLAIATNAILAYGLHIAFVKLQKERTLPRAHPDELILKIESSDLIFMGDSRNEMWFPQQAKICALNSLNLSQGSTTTIDLLEKARNLSEVISGKTIVIQSGINDIHWLAAVSNAELSRREKSASSNLQSATELLAKNNKVVLLTIAPPSENMGIRALYWPTNGKNIIDTLNRAIRSQQITTNVTVLDANRLLGNPNFLQEKFYDDDFFLHFNSEAYVLLEKNLCEILLEL